MRRRMLLMLAGVGLFIALIGFIKFQQIRTAIAQGASFQPPPEAVTTVVAPQEEWPATLTAIGSVKAVNGVTVSADLPGIVEKIYFTSGRRVGKGALLARLDATTERAQLASAEAQEELTKVNLSRAQRLLETQAIAQAEYDQVAATEKQARAHVGEIQATIERKTIRAPFAGAVGIRQIDLGQYLTGGAPIVTIQSMDPVYVDFSVPQQQAVALRPGARLMVVDSTTSGKVEGTVTAINSEIDEATRNVQVQGTFRNTGQRLKPGMYVDVEVLLGPTQRVIALPVTAINYAPYGNSVFVVTQMKDPKGKDYRGVQQRFVRLGASRGDQIAVLSGVQPGDEVVTSGVFKLRNGAAVMVNNAIQPSNNPAARPDNS